MSAVPCSLTQTQTEEGPATKRVTSGQLLGPRKEVVIVHDGREYRLRVTRNGKLILTA